MAHFGSSDRHVMVKYSLSFLPLVSSFTSLPKVLHWLSVTHPSLSSPLWIQIAHYSPFPHSPPLLEHLLPECSWSEIIEANGLSGIGSYLESPASPESVLTLGPVDENFISAQVYLSSSYGSQYEKTLDLGLNLQLAFSTPCSLASSPMVGPLLWMTWRSCLM